MYHIIVAYCKNQGIGYQNKIPWYISEDMKLFSKKTKGNGKNAIVMGRKTWESLPKTPLPKRFNIICSTTLDINTETTKSFSSIDDIHHFCQDSDFEEVWIIGGENIYKAFLKEATTIHATVVLSEYTCDVFFPPIPDNFQLLHSNSLTLESRIDVYEKETYQKISI